MAKKHGLKQFDKKGQAGLLLGLLGNPVVLIVLAIILFMVIAATVGFAVFFAFNVFTMLGIVVGILGAVKMFKGGFRTGLIMLGVGLFLVILPSVSSVFSGFTLGAVVP